MSPKKDSRKNSKSQKKFKRKNLELEKNSEKVFFIKVVYLAKKFGAEGLTPGELAQEASFLRRKQFQRNCQPSPLERVHTFN